MPKTKEKSMSRISRKALTDAEETLEDLQTQYLRKNGWTFSCDFPGSVWLWVKELPDGRIVGTVRPVAILMQHSWPKEST